MKMTKEIEDFINLTITEHMGKAYAEWKMSQPSVTEPDGIEEEYQKVIAMLTPEQEETITEFFYRLGLRDGMKLKKLMKLIITQLS